MTPEVLKKMQHALIKDAGIGSTLVRYARPLVMQAGALRGAGAGAALGAGANVAREAAGGGKDYYGAALRGAAGGALLGAGTGFGAGKVRDVALTSGKRGLALAGEAGKRTAKAVGNFGKRQVHGATGLVPKAGPQSIGLAGGAEAAKIKTVKALRDAKLKGVASAKKQKKITETAEKQIKSLGRRGGAAKETYRAGLTSIPGTIKSLVKDPKRLGKAVLKQVRQHPGGVVGAAALPAALTAGEIAQGTAPGEALGGAVGDVAGLALTGGMPIIPGMAAWSALSEGGRAIGRSKSKKRRNPRVSPPAPSHAQIQPMAQETTQ